MHAIADHPPAKAQRIRYGLYRILNVRCRCGGELHAERCKADGTPIGNTPEFRWETFCTQCLTCDPNGWPTLRECLANAAEYFSGVTHGVE